MRNWSCPLSNPEAGGLAKSGLRKTLRTARTAIAREARQDAALAVRDLLVASPVFSAATHIGCYLAQGSELDLQPVIELIWATHKHCYLPVLADTGEKHLHFIAYQAGDPLQVNHHAIREPLFTAATEIAPAALDLVLVPLIGFDRAGHRLGSGSGYYDRTFAFLCETPRPQQPYYVGVGYEAQAVAQLPGDAWDVRMDAVLTEVALTPCR